MKVLMLPSWYPHEADSLSGIFVRRQIEAVRHDCNVAVLFVLPDADIQIGRFEVETTTEDGINITRVRFGSSLPSFCPTRVIVPGYDDAAEAGLAHLLTSWGVPDLCHVHVLPHPGRIALQLKARFGIPYIISEHWSGYLPADGRFLQSGNISLTHSIVAGAHAVAPVSTALRNGMREQGLEAKYQVVPNVVPRRTGVLGPPQVLGELKLLCVARLDDREKNLSGLLQALGQLSKWQKARLKLNIVGDGPNRGALEALCRDLSLNGIVIFNGEQPNAEIGKWIASCHMLVCNSWFETFSISTAEALVHERPVIATDCGGPADYLSPAFSLVVPPGNTTALAEAIASAEDRYPDLARSVMEHFDPRQFQAEVVGEKILDLYNSALLSHDRSHRTAYVQSVHGRKLT